MSFKLPFGKKEENFPAMPESNIPVSQVLTMRAQGMQNNQIANQLRASGFSLSQIRDAISQADIKSAVTPPQGMFQENQSAQQAAFQGNQQSAFQGNQDLQMQGMPEVPPMPNIPEMPGVPPMPSLQSEPQFTQNQMAQPQQNAMLQPPQNPMPQLPSQPLPAGKSMETLVDELQRIIENIIEEKWKSVEQKISTLNAWKTKLEDKVGALNSKVSELTSRIDGFSKTMVSKDEDYKKTMSDVNTEMEAIEKLMGKLVPSLAEEIKELRGVVEKMKKH